MDENEVDEVRKKAKDIANDLRNSADLIENILGDDSILQRVKDAAEDAVEDDGLCLKGLIFYLLLFAIFVCLCWFAYKWYKNRQSMNNAIQNLEDTDENSSGNEETLNGPDSITVTSRIVTYADSSESSDSD